MVKTTNMIAKKVSTTYDQGKQAQQARAEVRKLVDFGEGEG